MGVSVPKYGRRLPSRREADTKPNPGNDNKLRDFWVYGKGRAKWNSWTELYHHLRKVIKGMSDERVKAIAAAWFHLRYGYWPGDHRNKDKSEVTVTSAGRTAVREAATVLKPSATGTYPVQLIRAGWSLNGSYYPAEVLRRDGPAAWPKGTLNYVDHDTDAEEDARPSGSLMRLASYQVDDARWDDERQALVANVRVFAPWSEAVASWAESGAIGMSIRAWVYGEHGEAEGRSGFVVTGIPEGRSCDYVTVPAAGGAILSAAMESVQRRQSALEGRTIGSWLESRLHLALTQYADDMYGDGRLTRPERIVLSGAIGDALQAWTTRVNADAPDLFKRDPWTYVDSPDGTQPDDAQEAIRAAEQSAEELRAALAAALVDAYGGKDVWTWVRDYDPDAGLVWFQISTPDSSDLFQQAFTVAEDGTVALDGDRVEVVARTVYRPVDDAGAEPGDPGETEEAISTSDAPGAADRVAPEDVTDGAPPTGSPNPPTEEDPDMSGTQTGAPPEQAGTATVVDTPATTSNAEATNAVVLQAMQAMTAQVTALTEANNTLAARLDRRDAEDRVARNQATAREAVTAALAAPEVPADLRGRIAPRVTATVLAHIPVGESGDVDHTALGARVAEAIAAESGYVAQLLEAAGVGRPSGLASQPVQPQTADEFEKSMAEAFEAIGTPKAAAVIAGKGRG
jgi:hypothetical protein